MTPRNNDQRVAALRKALGYIQNDSQVTVKIFQDDATRDYYIEFGKSGVWAKSFSEALDKLVVHFEQSEKETSTYG